LRTLFIARSILTEWTVLDYKGASPFLSVIVERPNVDLKMPFQYLTLLLKIGTKSEQYLKQSSDEAD
jgi:hypothetical protein